MRRELSKAEIIYEDRDILVVDKPANLVVNRSKTCKEDTLQDQLSRYFGLRTDLGIGGRAGIVHRLDRETSGLLIVAKSQEAFDFLQRQFKERKVQKEYVGLVHGFIRDESGEILGQVARVGKFGKFGVVNGGRAAATQFQVSQRLKFRKDSFYELIQKSVNGYGINQSRINYLKQHAQDYTLTRLFPKTGRTHQLRVHLKSIGHPVVSDSLYDPAKLLKFDRIWCSRLFLHATRLAFIHPKTQKSLEFSLGLPNDLKGAILYLKAIDYL